MILADSSAWIEFLRDTGSPACLGVMNGLIRNDLVVCDAVRMEVLVGARSDVHAEYLRDLLARAEYAPTLPEDYDHAAILYRQCRRNGETVRKTTDCLIAAVSIRVGAPVLHMDQDYDTLARHTPMQSYQPA